MATAIKAKTPAATAQRQETIEALRTYAQNFPKDIAYADIPARIEEDGWRWRLTQEGPVVVGDGITIVTFEAFAAKGADSLSSIDTISVALPSRPGPTSVAARAQAETSLIYMVSGRFPPAPEAAGTARPAVEPTPPDAPIMNGHDLSDAPDEPQVDSAPAPTDVVASRTQDVLPVFADLYELATPAPVVVSQVLDEVRRTLPGVKSVEGVEALWSKNQDAMLFVRDFANEEQKSELKDLFTERKNALSSGPAAPRRRQPAAH